MFDGEHVMSKPIINAMTVDVEDYFQVSALANQFPPASWDSQQLRVEIGTDKLLELFDKHQIKATFFTLGWVALKCPELVKRIVDQGHELACHGHGHQRVSDLTRTQFFEDLYRSKSILEQLCGHAVIGYRAPSFSINNSNRWAFDVMKEVGIKYSSSTYPIKHDHYGVPGWPRNPYEVNKGIIEIPLTTLKYARRTVPIAGGGYFRLAPYFLSRWALARYHQEEQRSGVFYIHPWELDVDQPVVQGIDLKTRFRHYVNLHKVEPRMDRLLRDFNWSTMQDVYADYL